MAIITQIRYKAKYCFTCISSSSCYPIWRKSIHPSWKNVWRLTKRWTDRRIGPFPRIHDSTKGEAGNKKALLSIFKGGQMTDAATVISVPMQRKTLTEFDVAFLCTWYLISMFIKKCIQAISVQLHPMEWWMDGHTILIMFFFSLSRKLKWTDKFSFFYRY